MPRFFKTAAAFRSWLAKHAGTERELIVGFHKLGTGRLSMTWPESVDEALCHGWIDGVRTRIDEESYKIRFTPRKPGSTWSAINIGKAQRLEAQGRMAEAGREAFSRRREEKSGIYSYEQRESAQLSPEDEAMFRKSRKAWKFFESQPPGYRRLMIHHVVSGKRPGTRQSRLARLIEASGKGVRL
jgi:uncharacterized protein YdeI (YjbR/CyaY-like superfamily)